MFDTIRIIKEKLRFKKNDYHSQESLLPEMSHVVCDFKPGEYVSRLVSTPYEEDYLEYGEIVGPYKDYKDLFYVKKLGDQGEGIWYGTDLQRISELDAFLKTLES